MRDIHTGEVVGEHLGTQFYTLGQKKGLGLFQSHLVRHVVHLDVASNTVWVGEYEDCLWTGLRAEGANYLIDLADLPRELEVQVRYRTAPSRRASFTPTSRALSWSLPSRSSPWLPARAPCCMPGRSCWAAD